jgi:hypothetical protein
MVATRDITHNTKSVRFTILLQTHIDRQNTEGSSYTQQSRTESDVCLDEFVYDLTVGTFSTDLLLLSCKHCCEALFTHQTVNGIGSRASSTMLVRCARYRLYQSHLLLRATKNHDAIVADGHLVVGGT